MFIFISSLLMFSLLKVSGDEYTSHYLQSELSIIETVDERF